MASLSMDKKIEINVWGRSGGAIEKAITVDIGRAAVI